MNRLVFLFLRPIENGLLSRRRALGAAALGLALLLSTLTPQLSWACACGCGVFEVGTSSLYPQGSGGTVWFEYDYMNQYLNWHATRIASAGRNDDRVLRTHFMTLGAQYMFDRDWGVQLELGLHSILDACRQCGKYHRGYTMADGQLICRVCGNKYKLVDIERGEGSCVPIALPRTQTQDKVEIKVADLKRASRQF